MKINQQYKSPNYDHRPTNTVIDTIILHYTEMPNCISAIERLCDPIIKVSCHYIIAKDGSIYNIVSEEYRAWHAGVSYWDRREKVNDFSIGIELDNNGKESFAVELMDSLIILCKDIIKRNPIKQHYVLGHSDVAIGRKIDPGRLFEWTILHQSEIGLFPNINNNEDNSLLADIYLVQEKLKEFGYNIIVTGIEDQQTKNVIAAFCDHFYPENENNVINFKLLRILEQLLLLKN